jgi:N-methylhydantoinase A
MNKILGIDIGGTFTDFLVIDEFGKTIMEKVASTKTAPYEAIAEGLSRLNLKANSLSQINYGTTIATNTLLERSGTRTGLITTKGFRDIIEMQRWHRQYLYDLHQSRPRSLIERKDRVTVEERITSDGKVIFPIVESQVVEAIKKLVQQGVGSIAVCLINAYKNPEHENKIKEIAQLSFPELPISISSEICPIIREFERTIVTAINAYTQPIFKSHLDSLYLELRQDGFMGDFGVIQSNGGTISVDVAKAEPVRTVLSGPAGGVIGASFIGQQIDEPNLITLDMGGTSSDVSIVLNGQPVFSKEEEIEWNIPISLPMISVKTIGAGGGSMAWVDAGDVLKVGPQSAGSNPGPACYGNGGVEPTLTDAQLLLGRLTETGLLGGRIPLDKSLATKTFKQIEDQMELKLIDVAAGVIRIANQRMIEAIKLVTIDRGSDPRDFALFAFGGAGPLHASEIARELGIGKIVIPPSPGVLSALGLAVADIKTSQITSVNMSFDKLEFESLVHEFKILENKASNLLDSHSVPSKKMSFLRSADIRYENQSYDLSVPLDNCFKDGLESWAESFQESHKKNFHFSMPDAIPFLVNIEVTGVGKKTKPQMNSRKTKSSEIKAISTRKVYFVESGGFLKSSVYNRENLSSGDNFYGPAIIDQFDTTTLIPPKSSFKIDSLQNIIINLGE